MSSCSICEKVLEKGAKTKNVKEKGLQPIREASKIRRNGLVLICCLGHHSQTFSTLELLPAHFCNFSPHFDIICLDNSLNTPF